jgi:hypothetical protein
MYDAVTTAKMTQTVRFPAAIADAVTTAKILDGGSSR